MDKKILAIVNIGITINEFEENFYICPKKNYSFNKSFDFIAGHYKKEIKYLASIRARGVVKLIGNEFIVSEKTFNRADMNIVDSLLIETYKKAQKMGIYDRRQELKEEGNQVFLLENVEEINARYAAEFTQFSKRYVNLISSERITFDILVSKLRNKDLNGYDFKSVDLDDMEETHIPGYFNNVGEASLPDIMTSQKILFCNIGWMKEYKGPEDEKMRTGGAFVRQHGYGLEMYNFYVDNDGYCRGYVRSPGTNKVDDFESSINLKRIDPAANSDRIDNILVVWIASNDKDKYGSRVVGFYQNATVYSRLQKRFLNNKENIPFLIEAKKEDVFCIPEEFRKKTVKRGAKGFLGQSNVWYADSQDSDVENFVKDMKRYVYDVMKGMIQDEELKNEISTWIIPCDKSKYDIEGVFRKFDCIEWRQTQQLNSIKPDDIVYIYVGAPLSRVQYKCLVEETGIQNSIIDDSEFLLDKHFFKDAHSYFRMRLLKKTNSASLKLTELNKNGLLGNIQGSRQLKDSLLNYIDKNVDDSEAQTIAAVEDLEIFSQMEEEELEAVLNAKDDSAGYAYKTVLTKYRIVNQQIINDLKSKYSGRCQICGEQVGGEYGEGIVHAHHIEYFCKAQNNDSSNIMIVCPNHHSIIHKHNAKLNRETMCYEFGNGAKLKIKLPGHLIK